MLARGEANSLRITPALLRLMSAASPAADMMANKP